MLKVILYLTVQQRVQKLIIMLAGWDHNQEFEIKVH